jgi:hypothetical protein
MAEENQALKDFTEKEYEYGWSVDKKRYAQFRPRKKSQNG